MIRTAPTANGYEIFDDGRKVAALNTLNDVGNRDKVGAILWAPMKKEDWRLHFTSPEMSVELVSAILEAIPSEAAPASAATPAE